MEKQESFRERNLIRRQERAFNTFYAYAQRTGVSDPKRAAEQAVRRIHAGPGREDGRGGGRAGTPRGSGEPRTASGGGEENAVPHRLEDRTRDQLYERARELDIEGRSQMNKDELIAAIRERN